MTIKDFGPTQKPEIWRRGGQLECQPPHTPSHYLNKEIEMPLFWNLFGGSKGPVPLDASLSDNEMWQGVYFWLQFKAQASSSEPLPSALHRTNLGCDFLSGDSLWIGPSRYIDAKSQIEVSRALCKPFWEDLQALKVAICLILCFFDLRSPWHLRSRSL